MRGNVAGPYGAVFCGSSRESASLTSSHHDLSNLLYSSSFFGLQLSVTQHRTSYEFGTMTTFHELTMAINLKASKPNYSENSSSGVFVTLSGVSETPAYYRTAFLPFQ